MVGRHSKKVEQNEAQLSSLIERLVSPSVTLRHPNALSRVAITLLDADGSHLPAYVMATSLALARQGQMAEPLASLQVAVYEGGNGAAPCVVCVCVRVGVHGPITHLAAAQGWCWKGNGAMRYASAAAFRAGTSGSCAAEWGQMRGEEHSTQAELTKLSNHNTKETSKRSSDSVGV